MDLFVQSDCSVRDTVRDITEAVVGFVPVEVKVDPSFVDEMKTLYTNLMSTSDSLWINVGYGVAGSQLTVKHLCPPANGQELSAHARFWQMCVSLCEMCLHQYRDRMAANE